MAGRTDARTEIALRPLGLPQPLEARLDERGELRELRRPARRGVPARRLAVDGIEEAWRVAEEWWREAPLRRTYYRVLVDGGRPLTLFHDDTAAPSKGWYEQRY